MEDSEAELKLCCVGNSKCGKTSLLLTWKNGSFPANPPLKADEFNHKFDFEGQTWEIEVIDTRAVDTEDRYRPMNYEGTNVFLMCFSYDDPQSIKAISDNWVKEVSHHCHVPTPYFLVGLKADGPHQVTDEQVENLIKDKTCSEAFTVSAKTGAGTAELFAAIYRAAVGNYRQTSPDPKDKQTAILKTTSGSPPPSQGSIKAPRKGGGRSCVLL